MNASGDSPAASVAARPPASNHPRNEWLEQTLERISVRSVTAILHRCASDWAMPSRRIGDDMLFCILKGRGRTTVAGQTYDLLPGICASFRRGVEHAAFHDPRHPIHVIALHYTATVFESLSLPELVGFPDVFRIKGDLALEALLREACREYARRPPGWERGLEALATRILLQLIRRHGAALRAKSRDTNFADLRRLLPTLNAMKKNLAEPASIPALAKSAGFSEAQFRRVFGRAIRMTPIQYLCRIRMEHACGLLRRTPKTMEAIASEVGYAEPSSFAHGFKKRMRIAPGEYRRKHEL